MKLFNLFNWVTNLVEAFTFYSGGGSGGGGSQTSTSYSTNLPEYAQPYYQELMKQTGKNVYSTDSSGNVTGVKGMPTYTGERVAGFNPDQTAVQSNVAGMTRPGGFDTASSGLGAGQSLGYGTAITGLGNALNYNPQQVSTGQFDNQAASQYMSPYLRASLDPQLAYQEKLFGQQNSADALGALNRGTFGGARQSLLYSQNLQNQNMNLGNILGQGLNTGYNNAQQQFNADQARALQAQQANQQAQGQNAALQGQLGQAGLTAGIDSSAKQAAVAAAQQTSDLERLKAQAATGAEKQALQQKIDDLQYQTFQDQQNYQKSQLEYLSNILRGNAAALGSTQVQYTPQPSTASQISGLGLAGLGLAKALG